MYRGPWYETQGPGLKHVIKDQLSKAVVHPDYVADFDEELYRCALESVLGGREEHSFGSWRGYACFGLKAETLDEIRGEYEAAVARKKALGRLGPWLYRVSMRKLYNPLNGLMMRRAKKEFEENREATSTNIKIEKKGK